MNVKYALARARETLHNRNIPDTPLESEILLRHTLKISRAQLYSGLQNELSPVDEDIFQRLIERRLSGEPSAYITGHREFYGLDFYVDRWVLIPRAESELLVEKAVNLSRSRPISTIADIGTGSGAIAISLAVNLPSAKIYAIDVSAPVLEVARINCERNGVEDRVRLLEGNMLHPLPGPVDLIVANLPYVREDEIYGPLRFEPALALDGGSDGLDRIKGLCRQAGEKLLPGGSLLLEIGKGQGEAVTGLLAGLYPSARIEVFPDLSGIDRVVGLYLTAGRF